MSQTQKTKPEYLVIELSGRGFSLLAKKHDADALARLCLQSSLSFEHKKSVFPGVDSLNFFYVTERARAQLVLTQYRAQKTA
jgi:hypothetical protein